MEQVQNRPQACDKKLALSNGENGKTNFPCSLLTFDSDKVGYRNLQRKEIGKRVNYISS